MKYNQKIVEEFLNALEPRTSNSKHAGFRGRRDVLDIRKRGKYQGILIRISGWCQYSSKISSSWHITRAGLIVEDETDVHMVRVPPNIESVFEAHNWLMPAPVKKAKEQGSQVVRQGDFYFVSGRRENNFDALRGTNHSATIQDDGSVLIHHPEHTTTTLPSGKWRAYPQRSTTAERD